MVIVILTGGRTAVIKNGQQRAVQTWRTDSTTPRTMAASRPMQEQVRGLRMPLAAAVRQTQAAGLTVAMTVARTAPILAICRQRTVHATLTAIRTSSPPASSLTPEIKRDVSAGTAIFILLRAAVCGP